MELSEICPQPGKFTLVAPDGNEIELVLRPFSLMDEVGLMGIVNASGMEETGYQKLSRMLKTGEDFQNFISALLLTRGISEPILAEIERQQAAEEDKKKA